MSGLSLSSLLMRLVSAAAGSSEIIVFGLLSTFLPMWCYFLDLVFSGRVLCSLIMGVVSAAASWFEIQVFVQAENWVGA